MHETAKNSSPDSAFPSILQSIFYCIYENLWRIDLFPSQCLEITFCIRCNKSPGSFQSTKKKPPTVNKKLFQEHEFKCSSIVASSECSSAENQCPHPCSCANGIVDCREKSMTKIPTHLPEDTTELWVPSILRLNSSRKFASKLKVESNCTILLTYFSAIWIFISCTLRVRCIDIYFSFERTIAHRYAKIQVFPKYSFIPAYSRIFISDEVLTNLTACGKSRTRHSFIGISKVEFMSANKVNLIS